jgi:hypothetical protein
LFENKELSELVRATIEGVEKGLKEGYTLTGDIEFEVAVVNMENVEGGIKLYVVKLGGKHGEENVTKIKFKVGKGKGGRVVVGTFERA